MRAVAGVMVLLLALALVAVLVKKQSGAVTSPTVTSTAPAEAALPPTQLPQLPQQVKSQVEGLLQAPRPEPEGVQP